MTVLYLSFSNNDLSTNAVYIKGLRKNNVEVLDFFSNQGRFQRFIDVTKYYWQHRESADYVFVGYESPLLVIWLACICRKKIIYNALCSVYERIIVARSKGKAYSFTAFKCWIEDFLAIRCADLVMLETNQQIAYFQKLFRMSEGNKFFRAWTSVDEDKFFFDPTIAKRSKFTVIFRGSLMPESGAEFVIPAAKLLEKSDIQFIMHVSGKRLDEIRALITEHNVSNLELISERLPIETVRTLLQSCHISLGQLSTHSRVDRTVPHKAYESLALKLPYLTARNKGIMELLKDGETCITCNPADPKDLADKIVWAREHQHEREQIAENGYAFFLNSLRGKTLAAHLLDTIPKIEQRKE